MNDEKVKFPETDKLYIKSLHNYSSLYLIIFLKYQFYFNGFTNILFLNSESLLRITILFFILFIKLAYYLNIISIFLYFIRNFYTLPFYFPSKSQNMYYPNRCIFLFMSKMLYTFFTILLLGSNYFCDEFFFHMQYANYCFLKLLSKGDTHVLFIYG